MNKLILKKHPNFEFSLIELMNVIVEVQNKYKEFSKVSCQIIIGPKLILECTLECFDWSCYQNYHFHVRRRDFEMFINSFLRTSL